MFRALETDTLLSYALPRQGPVLLRVRAARHLTESYLDAASVQVRRIEQAGRRVGRAVARRQATSSRVERHRDWSRAFATMNADIHFYLICWAQIHDSLSAIRDATGFRPVKQALRPFRLIFERYQHMRDVLEHRVDYLTGRGKRTLRIPQDFGNFSRTHFTFGGDVIDIGRAGFQNLRTAVQRVESALKAHAWEVISRSQPDVADRLAFQVQRDRAIEKMRRQWTPEGARLVRANQR